MSHNSVFCGVHHEEATLFCLCSPALLYICPTCLPKHEGHEQYPVAQADLFQAIGRNKDELKRRNTLSQVFQSFLDRMMGREAAVQSGAEALMSTVTQTYKMWLEENHRCFDSLLSTLREETAMLLTRPKYRLSTITQSLLEKLKSPNFEGEQVFFQVPEIEALTNLNDRCQEACSRAPKMWQMEYEAEVLQALTTRQVGPQEKVTVRDESVKLETAVHQLQTDFETTDKECESPQKEIKTLRNLDLSQTSQLDESRLSLEKNLTRILELEGQNKKLNIQLDTTTQELQALQAEFRTQANQLTEYQQRSDEALKTCSELERQLKELGQQQDETRHQLQAARTECEAKAQNCAALERERTELQIKVLSQANQIQETEALFKQNVAEMNEKHSVLEARLRKWGITTDPPTDFQEPDYSTPQSRAALAKFGPYSDQDDELILVKRAPVTDDEGVYIGQWNSRDQKHGYGKFLWTNGDIYEGQWRNGERTGRGRVIWANNGEVYVGDFLQNKKEGFGTYYYANGDEYSGAWVNEKRNGVCSLKYGETTQHARDRYFGEYSDEMRDGIGAYFWKSGEMYVGSWKSNKPHGKGLQGRTDGQMYFGEWKGGEKSGIGCFVYANGKVYRGQWSQNKKVNALITERLSRIP